MDFAMVSEVMVFATAKKWSHIQSV